MIRGATSARPTGPIDEEFSPGNDDEGYPEPAAALIGEAFDAYMKAHDYRKSKQYVAILNGAFNQFLTASKLHEKHILGENHQGAWAAVGRIHGNATTVSH
jgi:hypothetical protein